MSNNPCANPDILENILRKHKDLLEGILIDRTRTTKVKTHNIMWMTDSYAEHKPKQEIKVEDITGENTFLIRPRISKSKEEQRARTHDKAEVFTPKEIVSEMNQQIDWRTGHWPATEENWREYVLENRLEITCGEAPFIVGRYNAANGRKVLKLDERVGFLDRKLQVVSKFCDEEDEWVLWAKNAFKASYGYEWQGDNLLIARENLLYTFIDYWNDKFPQKVIDLENKLNGAQMKLLLEIVEIISWNIFQMDGMENIIPMSQSRVQGETEELPLLKLLCDNKRERHENRTNEAARGSGKKVKIMDWGKGKTILFERLLK